MSVTQASAAASGGAKSTPNDSEEEPSMVFHHCCFLKLELDDGKTLVWPALLFNKFSILEKFMERRGLASNDPLCAAVNHQYLRYVMKDLTDTSRDQHPVALLMGKKTPTGRRLVFCPTNILKPFTRHLAPAVHGSNGNLDFKDAMDMLKEIMAADNPECPPSPTKVPRPQHEDEAMEDETNDESAKPPAKSNSNTSSTASVASTNENLNNDDEMSVDGSESQEESGQALATETPEPKNAKPAKSSKVGTRETASDDQSEAANKAADADEADDDSDASVQEESPPKAKTKRGMSVKDGTRKEAPIEEEADDESDASVEEESPPRPKTKSGNPTKSKNGAPKKNPVEDDAEASDESDESVEEESPPRPKKKSDKPTTPKTSTRSKTTADESDSTNKIAAHDDSDASVEEESPPVPKKQLTVEEGAAVPPKRKRGRPTKAKAAARKHAAKKVVNDESIESDASVEEESLVEPKQMTGKTAKPKTNTRRVKSVDRSTNKAKDGSTDVSVAEEAPAELQRKRGRSSKAKAMESAKKTTALEEESDASVSEEESPARPQRKRAKSSKAGAGNKTTKPKATVGKSASSRKVTVGNDESDESVATNELESPEKPKNRRDGGHSKRKAAPTKAKVPVADKTSDESVATNETETPKGPNRKRDRSTRLKAAPKKTSVDDPNTGDDSLSFVGSDEDSPAKRTRSSKKTDTAKPKNKKVTNARRKVATTVTSKKGVSQKRKGDKTAALHTSKRPKRSVQAAVDSTTRKPSQRIAAKATNSGRNAIAQAIVATPESSPEQSGGFPREVEVSMPKRIPTLEEVRPLLKKGGINYVNGRYVLKGVDPSKDKYIVDRDYFENGARLRRYLCAYGIESNGYEWTEREKEVLRLWVRTSIIPGLRGVKDNIPAEYRSWVDQTEIHKLLMTLGFQCVQNIYYVLPGEKPNVVGGLLLNGRGYLGEDGLQMYLARFGLPLNCTFDQLTNEARIRLEYDIALRAKVDTFTRFEAKETDPVIFSEGDDNVPRAETTRNSSPTSSRSVADATLITNSTSEDKVGEEEDDMDAGFRPDGDTSTQQDDADHHSGSKDSPTKPSDYPITQPDCDQSTGSGEASMSPCTEVPDTKDTKGTKEHVERIDQAAAEDQESDTPLPRRYLFSETPAHVASPDVGSEEEKKKEDSSIAPSERAPSVASPPTDAFQKEINDMLAKDQSPDGSENIMDLMEDSPKAASPKASIESSAESSEEGEAASTEQSPVDDIIGGREVDSEISRARSAQVRMSDGKSVPQSLIKLPSVMEKEDDTSELVEVKPDDPWDDAESKMMHLGWKHHKGNGLVTDLWLPPGGKPPHRGGILNEDYVEELFGMKLYAHKHFGWKGDEAFHKELQSFQSMETSRTGRAARRKVDTRPETTIDEPGTTNKRMPTRSSPGGAAKAPSKKRAAAARTSPRAKKPNAGEVASKKADAKLRAGHPDLKKTVGEKLLACQNALATSLNVKSLSAADGGKTAFQRNVGGITTFLRGVVGSEGAHGRTKREASCLYVCGAPGTGKTTSVNWAIKETEKWASEKHGQRNLLPSFCYINAANIGSANQVSETIADALSLKGKRSLDNVKRALDSGRGRSSKTSCLVVVIDEIEVLVSETGRTSSGEKVLKMLGDWSSDEDLRFAMIGISNSIGDQKANRLQTFGLTDNTITFSTYRQEDLVRIVQDRIGKKIVDPKAIEFAAKKVAAKSGDARAILELVSSATDKCLHSLSPAQRKGTTMDTPVVSMKTMLNAAKDTVTDCVEKLDSVAELAKTVLYVAVTLNQVGKVSERLTIGKLKNYVYQAQDNGLFDDDMSVDDFNTLIQQLIDAGLLLHGTADASFDVSSQNYQSLYEKPIRLGVLLHDVESAIERTLTDQPVYRAIVERAKKLG